VRPLLALLAASLPLCCGGTERSASAPRGLAQVPVDAASSASTRAPEPEPAELEAEHSPIGTNLAELADYSGEWVFVDAFKQSRAWISGSEDTWEDGRPLDLDERGWVRSLLPGQIARTVMFWREGMNFPSGNYVILYEGEGKIRYFGNERVLESRRGRDLLQVDAKQAGIALFLTATNPKNPLRNIAVLLPGGACKNDAARACKVDVECQRSSCVPFERDHRQRVFHPDFLRTLAGYSVLRFMDWTRTNDSELVRWEDRPKPDDARYTVKGVPIEVTIDLANRLKADPWYNVPHRADDGYVRGLAELVRTRLDRERRVYVEHSNEVWNSVFSQSEFARRRGAELGLSKDPFEAQLRWHARRSRQVFELFARAVSGPRLIRVMGSQASNAWVSSVLLEHEGAGKLTDALAIAPYFGGYLGEPEAARRVERLALDQLMEELEARGVDEAAAWVTAQAALAHEHGVDLIAYEGGQHLTGVGPALENPAINRLFDAANRDRRMHGIYLRFLERWREQGGSLFVHYLSCGGYSKWGRWGALETPDQDRRRAPKYAALREFIEHNAAWW
jgi:hypothetical protein